MTILTNNYKLINNRNNNIVYLTFLAVCFFDYELVSLREKTVSGCIACLGCVQDNICKVDDDMAGLRDKIVEADAYVVGSPNHYPTLNVKTHAFIERLFQFRHQEGNIL